jgi:radical SAM superfamily enzyme YgiQ (UPF0313 family)
MHKGITLEQTINVFHWAKKLGIYTKVFFTFGHIDETIQEARKTVEFMEKYAKYISVAATGIGIRIYPGTEVERYAHSIKTIDENFYWTSSFNDSDIESLGNDPLIPILIQPQFGWHEFRKIEFRLVRFWLKNPYSAFRVLWNHIKLGRGRILFRLIISFTRKHFLFRYYKP